jgi:phosphatidyl-myo-inositol alpha-mannosyltransferase
VKILQACPYSWDAPGGVQVHVRELAARLIDRGHEVIVLAPARQRPTDDFVHSVGGPIRIPYQGTVAPICPWPWSAWRVRRERMTFQPDVVHAHEPLVPSTSMYVALGSEAPVVATFHAYAERSRLFDVAAPVLRFVWRRIALPVAVSEAAASFVGDRFGDRIRVVPNGVDIDLFGEAEPPPDRPPGRRILWVGRLDPQKGFPVAVRAFGRLARDFPDVSFVVVGDGPDRPAVEMLPADLRARVDMVGAVPHAELPKYLSAANVFVAPSLGQESFGMVLIEAMAVGLPVVASDIAGYREVARDGVQGLLVPPGDPEALAGSLHRVLEDGELAMRLRTAGRVRALEFSWARVVDRIEAVYKEAIGG